MTTSLPNSQKGQPPDNAVAERLYDVGETSPRLLFSLGERLFLCASMVRPHAAVTDIGTDHAYLPIWLIKKGLVRSAVAADIRPGPLQTASDNIRRFHVSDRISARLSDGLQRVLPEEADDIVIAGMGGKTIIHIIENAEWLKNPDKHLILQPMTSVPDLRVFLAENGFSVQKEEAAEEDGHVYTAMLVIYDPENTARGKLYPYIGSISANTEANQKYISRQAHRLEKRAHGLRLCGEAQEAVKIDDIIKKIKDLLYI